MCGRFIVSYTYDEMVKLLHDDFSIIDLDQDTKLPRYNVAPGQEVLSIINDGAKYRVGTFKWGLIPSFSISEKTGYKMINARSETIDVKPSFKESFLKRRCVILSDGFYEWDKLGDKKPYMIQKEDKNMFAYAGIWDKFKSNNGRMVYTCAMLTIQSNEILSDIHDRMPIMLDTEQAKQWIKQDNSIEKLKGMFLQYDASKLVRYRVSERVNKVQNDDLSNLNEITEYKLF